MEGAKTGDDDRSVGSPAAGTRPPAPAPVEIVAPEAVPAVEQAGAPPSLLARGQPVLPEEGGVPIVTEPISIQWAEEALAAGPTEKWAGKAVAPTEKVAQRTPAPLEKAAEKALAPPQKAAQKALEPPEEAVEKPRPPAGPLYPYFSPLPPQFRGTLADIQRFIGAGELVLLAGGLVFFALALAAFGAAVLDTRHPWTAPHVADDVMWGILCIILSAGSFFCLVLSRRKLRGAFLRNDFTALHRRLVPACAAGLVLGLFIGGVLFFLAYIKVDELPAVQKAKFSRTGQKAVH